MKVCHTPVSLIAIGYLLGTWVSFAVAQTTATTPAVAKAEKKNNYIRWLDRPWEYRYLLRVQQMSSYEGDREDKPDSNLKSAPGFTLYWRPGPFPASWMVRAADSANGLAKGDQFAVQRIDIAPDRSVLTPSDLKEPLEARLNWYEDIVFAPRRANPEYVVQFGQFFIGSITASDMRYSPSICNTSFEDNVSPGDRTGRYVEKNYDPISSGYFGCREWTAQLYDGSRPYIDVTSYEMGEDYTQPVLKKGPRKGKHPLAPQTWIKHFVGFSRFEDPPKPVIGNHDGTWLCLNDCPNGDAPGQIPDIKAWAARNHWDAPQKPKNVREFRDKKVNADDFMD